MARVTINPGREKDPAPAQAAPEPEWTVEQLVEIAQQPLPEVTDADRVLYGQPPAGVRPDAPGWYRDDPSQ